NVMFNPCLEFRERSIKRIAVRIHCPEIVQQILHLLMFAIRLVHVRLSSKKNDVPDRRIENFFLGLRMLHHVPADLLEQSFPERAIDSWRHLQGHDQAAHHTMILLQDRGYPHGPLLDDWNQWNQRRPSRNPASHQRPLHSTRSLLSSGHS